MEPTQVTQPKASNALAITALVVGIVAFCFGWAAIFGMIVGAAAIVFGIIALVKKQHKVMSVFGLVLGSIAFISSLIFTVLGAAILNDLSNQNTSNPNNSNQSEMTDGKWDAAAANAAYDKVTSGMSKAEVEATVEREPQSCSEFDSEVGVTETCLYGNVVTDDVTFSVTYTDGVVSSKMKNS